MQSDLGADVVMPNSHRAAWAARRRAFWRGMLLVGHKLFDTPKGDLDGLAHEAPLWVTSEKDAVKILPAWARRIDLRVLTIELDVEQGEALVDWVEQQLR